MLKNGTASVSASDAAYDSNSHDATFSCSGAVTKPALKYRNLDTNQETTEAPVNAGSYKAFFDAGGTEYYSRYKIAKADGVLIRQVKLLKTFKIIKKLTLINI